MAQGQERLCASLALLVMSLTHKSSRLMPHEASRPGASGGSFDFESYELSHEVVGEPLYAEHEREHSGFVRGTVFGVAQRTAESIYSEIGGRDLARFKWALLKASLSTHERGATYCSVKLFPAHEQARLTTLLPPPYLAAYSDVARIVDAAFASTYTQYSLGKVLINHALNCRLHELPWDAEWQGKLGDFSVPPQFSPNERWDRLVTAVLDVGAEDLALRILDAVDARARDEGFPMAGSADDEALWLGLNAAAAQRLDGWLFTAVEKIVSDIAVDIPAVPSEEFDPAAAGMIEAIGRAAGRPLKAVRGPVSPMTPADVQARVANPDALSASDIPAMHQADVYDWFDTSPGPAYAVISQPNSCTENAEWILAYTVDTGTVVCRAHHADVIGALQRRVVMAQLGMPVRQVCMFVDGTSVSNLQPLYESLTPMFVLPIPESVMDLGSDELHWYMSGSIDAWIDTLTRFGRLRVLPVVPGLDKAGDFPPVARREEAPTASAYLETHLVGDMPQSTGGVGFFICQVTQLIGTFLRVMPTSAIGALGELLEEYDVDLWPIEQRKHRYERSAPLLRLALALRNRL